MKGKIAQSRENDNAEIPGMEAETWLTSKMARLRRVGVFAEVDDLTPARAALLLGRNQGNRILHDSHAAEIAQMMREGDWQLNGEALIVSETGELNDGQHRAAGVVKAGLNVPCVFVWGVTRQSRETVDKGRRRLYQHTLTMRGETNAANIGSALRYLNALLSKHALNSTYTEPMMDRVLAAHPAIRESVPPGRATFAVIRQSPSLGTALHYLFARRDRMKANAFFEALKTGAELALNSPIYKLRTRLIEDATAKARLNQTDVAALTIKAWNLYRAGRTIQALRWRTEGDKPEPFPGIE